MLSCATFKRNKLGLIHCLERLFVLLPSARPERLQFHIIPVHLQLELIGALLAEFRSVLTQPLAQRTPSKPPQPVWILNLFISQHLMNNKRLKTCKQTLRLHKGSSTTGMLLVGGKPAMEPKLHHTCAASELHLVLFGMKFCFQFGQHVNK